MKSGREKKANQVSQEIRPIIKEYSKERSAIRAQRATMPNAAEAIAQLNRKYESRLSLAVGREKARQVMARLDRKRNANTQDAKKYKLSYADAQKYDRLQQSDKQRHTKLDHTDLTRKARTERTQKLEEKNQEQMKALLGDHKFMQWRKDKNPNFDQRLKKRYGFSAPQLKQYKDIHNWKAIEMLKIRKGKGTQQEKQAKIEQIHVQAERKLDQILTAQQRSKMQKAQAKRTAIEAHTIKAPKKNVPQQSQKVQQSPKTVER